MDGKRWFLTGDIGEWQPDGCLKVIGINMCAITDTTLRFLKIVQYFLLSIYLILDRRKDLVKLQAGEYVSLGKVEAILKGSNFVDNICIYAESDKDYVIGLVVPTEATLRAIAENLNIATKDWDELCKNQALNEKVVEDIQRVAKIGKPH